MSKKQTVIKVDINCADCQMEIFSKVGKIKGVQSLVVDPEKKTVTVVGAVEPTPIFKALKKIKKNPEILTVGKPKPKCPYCKFFICACGIARFPASAPTELAPPPPGWRVPPPCTDEFCPPLPCPPSWCPPQPCNPGYCPPPPCTPLLPPCTPVAPPCNPLPSWCQLPPTPHPYYVQQQCDLVAINPDGPGNCTII